jgi:hypothetical protein
MATRHLIEQLSERTDAVAARLLPARRNFVMYVDEDEDADAKKAAFIKEHGVAGRDMLIVVTYVRSPNADRN